MTESTIEEAAALLAGAHLTGRRLDRLPDRCRPKTLEEAYAIQDATVRAIGAVGAWKVGRNGEDVPRCAPVPKHLLFESGVTLDPGRFRDAALEIEFAYRVHTALPPRAKDYRIEEIAAAVVLVPLIEIVGTRFLRSGELTPLEKLADLLANAAFVVGPPVTNWRELDLGATTVELQIDGCLVQRASGHGSGANPLALVTWLADHICRRAAGLKVGEIVTTGSLQGMTPIAAGSRALGIWRDWGRVELTMGSI
jgi:2-keto-4-pentenoate hydratase